MQVPLQITFRHMDPSEWIETMIREKAAKLEQFAEQITSCRVVIQPAGKHHRHGNLYDVSIDITMPGNEIVVSRTTGQSDEDKIPTVAIRDAFDSARRQVEDHMRRLRREVKTHEELPRARVKTLNPVDGFGFLVTPDGRDLYFHRNSVLNDEFDALNLGVEVAFREVPGDKGPQASAVKRIGKAARDQQPVAIG